MNNPFEDLTEILKEQTDLLNEILKKLNNQPVYNASEQPISTKEAAKFLMMDTQTLYQKQHLIPTHKKGGKLYYFKSELVNYIKSDDG